jgi:hypothetical protein
MMLWGYPLTDYWPAFLAIVVPIALAIRDIRKEGNTHDE